MTELQIGYIAGFFDGEGTIHVSPYSRKGKRKGEKSYQIVVRVGNTNRRILENIQSWLDYGYIFDDPTPRKKPFYVLIINHQEDKLKFLELILPFLIEKRNRAELVIEFLKLRLNTRRGKGCNCQSNYTKVELDWFKKYQERK
jgi:hypothetical protein